MELSEIPIWQYIATIWLTSWILTVYRTWGRIKWLLEASFPKHSVTSTPKLHFIVYIISINFVLIAAGIPIMFSDEQRDKWVKAYVTSVGKKL
tara:strand:+ start:113 stop:391 length:279 start_codon:yes stop_codon:yes gene_type:complete